MYMILICLHRPLDWIDKLICFFCRGIYCHVNVKINDIVYDCRPFKGVRRLKVIDDKKGKIVDLYEIPHFPKSHEREIIKFLESQVGKNYDWVALLGFILYINEEERNRYTCSQLTFAAFKSAGIHLLERVDDYKVSPTMISYSDKLKFQETIIVK